jgi:dihydropteroate synthase
MSSPTSVSGERGALRARGAVLAWGARTYVMGIVNASPDSFSGDGHAGASDAVAHAIEQAESGCDIVDIGGESTRPGAVPVDSAEECKRVIPVIVATRERLPKTLLSIDTYKADVARAGATAGADIINSVWGMPDDLLAVAVDLGMPIVIMHNKAEARYPDGVVNEVLAFLSEAAQRAARRGIQPHNIVLDPGIGFGKTADDNITILRELHRIVALGFPTLIGASRKSTIGKLTAREPRDRIFGTAATTALAVAAGVDIVRVHDVQQARDVVAVADAIVRDWRPAGWTG